MAWMLSGSLLRRASILFGAAMLTVASAASAVTADASLGMHSQSSGAVAYAATGAAMTIAAGRTPGAFGVTQSGAATYRIPLWTPPGVGDVDPELALVYGSRSGNGTLGVGWSIDGLSAITRCNRTWAQDGVPGGVTNTASDRYCLDGQQLKLVSGTAGSPGAIYGTEIESFARIVANGAIGGGPASFTVLTKQGLIYEYGGTADSRVYAGNSGTVRTWVLSSVRDRASGTSGNTITYAYYNDAQSGVYGDGGYRIASIAYPTTPSGAGPFYTVRFSYSLRPASDVPTGYLVGNVVREPYQLNAISVVAAGAADPIKTYNLSYGNSPSSGRLRLASVQECSATSCLRPTTFTYQDGRNGWTGFRETGVAASPNKAPVPIELNGDGLTDLLYPIDAGSGKVAWRIVFAGLSGYGAALDTGLVTPTSATIIPGQFIGNGRTQFLVPQNGYWYLAGIGTNGFTATSTGLPVGGEYSAADLDGDGLADLISQSGGTAPTFYVRRNVTTPTTGGIVAQFGTTAQAVWTSPRATMPFDNLRIADLNGDGRADIVALSFISTDRRSALYATPLLSNGFGLPFTLGPEQMIMQESMVTLGDWNGDGCSDLLQVYDVWVSDCAGRFIDVRTRATPATGASLYTAIAADWNSDGRTDLLYVDAATRQWWVVPSNGMNPGTPISTGIAAPSNTAWFVHDADGDGLTDLGYRDGGSGYRLRYQLHDAASTPPDLVIDFADGFGMHYSPAYGSIARGAHTPQADAVFPEADVQVPLYIVTAFAASDGAGGTYQNRFQYGGARMHLQGRGFEGFQWQRIQDTRTGFITYDYVQRPFPYTGMQTQRSVFQADGTTPVEQWVVTPGQRLYGNTGPEQRVFAFVVARSEQRFEYGGPLNGALITDTRHAYSYDDGYGNVTQVQATVTDKDPTSPFLNGAWQSTKSYVYANDATANWCLGLPVSSTETQSAPGKPALTRTKSYANDMVACRLTQQVIEPTTPSLKVVTSYAYDGCGNVVSLQVTGSLPAGTAMPTRTTLLDYGSRCQLPEAITNALGQVTRVTWRYDFGVPTRITDPNGIATTRAYDDFGRRTLETLPDRTQVAWSYESCSSGPCWGVTDLRFLVYESRLATDGSLVRKRHRFYDGLERLRYDEYHRALGTWTNVAMTYDALGNVTSVTNPYSLASNGQTARTFDPLGRLTGTRLVDGAGATVRSTTRSYAGRTVTHVDPLSRITTQVVDVTGRTRRILDPAPGGTTSYDYDSLGQLVRLQDPIGAVSTGAYNLRGFRTRWTDADAGNWTFVGDSLNQRIGWTDAKGQSFAESYDALGRTVTRTEPEGTSTFTWGTSPSAYNVGQLQSVSGLGYGEGYAYDSSGRLSTRTITSDQAYQYDYAYNSIGEIDTITWPVSPVPSGRTAARFKVRYGYSFGVPAQIEDVTDSAPRLLWALGSDSDFGWPTLSALAGGAITAASTFDGATGLPLALQAGTSSNSADRRNLSYGWDATGNLLQRRDLNRSLTESFSYDALDRLTQSSLNGLLNLGIAYDAAGNVTLKSDVGSYVYADPAHPHAATAAGNTALTYDANGNVATRNGLAQALASFNLPIRLTGNQYQSQFSYGPAHQRWRQVATYPNGSETTYYVGQLLQKESATSTGVTYWRHYVPLPDGSTVLISRNTNGTTATTYVLADHLGSSETLLSDTGALNARLSFTAFGARRGQDWSATTPPDWAAIANTTRQGFTAHEALDNLGFVHMGGRVYDPVLGRFLSPDPVIGDLTDSQAINPYAYVGNRPLVGTDPSGLEFVPVTGGPCGGVCETIIASAVATVLGMGHPHAPPPPATSLPGRSAQNGVGLCGAGTFSPTCGGMILYAGAGSPGTAGLGTSTWGATEAEVYAEENLERFLLDLGINAVDVLILAPYYDARGAVDAAGRGNYFRAAIQAGLAICGVAKPCQGAKSLRGLRQASSAVRGSAAEAEVVQRAMSRAELDATLRTGLLRGGRPGTHYVSDAVNSTSKRAQQRLALPNAPEVRVILRAPPGTFSKPSTVAPYRLPNGTVLKGGGTERTATGEVPIEILRVDDL